MLQVMTDPETSFNGENRRFSIYSTTNRIHEILQTPQQNSSKQFLALPEALDELVHRTSTPEFHTILFMEHQLPLSPTKKSQELPSQPD